jgi:hypothetical protein
VVLSKYSFVNPSYCQFSWFSDRKTQMKIIFKFVFGISMVTFSSLAFGLVPPCTNLDATNMKSGEFNVEDCGQKGTNLVTIPTSAQFKLDSNNGATCSAKVIGTSSKGQLVRLNSSLDVDSSQSCELFIYTGEQKATIAFLAQGS